MVHQSEGIQTKYQSSSPGKYWIKISDANKLREKALIKQLGMLNKEWKIELRGHLIKQQKQSNSQISERLTKLELENKKLRERIYILEGYKGDGEQTLKERLANQAQTIDSQLKTIEELSINKKNKEG